MLPFRLGGASYQCGGNHPVIRDFPPGVRGKFRPLPARTHQAVKSRSFNYLMGSVGYTRERRGI
ncbi:hypothetical protein N39L_33680 [Limnospira platensis NIES-39]|uniref:Uncharacterized protein n=1 Tax=Limnospira platensis NIES-46 TaxID=1236695 RepID=A0A5M3TFL2_LIMPL|nr:hypothetical protein N39L_33680 [Arthrospira platensis NIES-39]GCE96930.1 hypothetical protein NIES46_50050 [Arthrospira platensis NIES-46]